MNPGVKPVRRISILGDSISTFAGCNPPGYAVFFDDMHAAASGLRGVGDTWWALLAQWLGAEVLMNASYSGSMVEGAGFPAGESVERALALAPRGADGTATAIPDDIVVFLGTNDYGWGGAAAQAAGRSAATPPVALAPGFCPEPAVAGMAGPENLAGYARAYARMLANVCGAYPAAHVWCVSLLPGRLSGSKAPTFCWNLRGIPMRAYNEAIGHAAADIPNCTFLDAAAYRLDYEAVDGTHPTARGMRQIAALVAATMADEDSDGPAISWGYSPEDGGPQAWASRELCPDRGCVGCPHARGTGNAWSCVCER